LTTAPSAPESRSWDPEAVGDWSQEHLRVRPRVIPDLGAALDRASTLAPHGTILVTGSFHTVRDAMRLLDIPAYCRDSLGSRPCSPRRTVSTFRAMPNFASLPGFRDFYPEEFAVRSYIFGVWREVARRYGFQEYDGPPL